MSGIDDILQSGQAPSFHGRRKPGSAQRPVFDRPRPLQDCIWTAKNIEETGKMTPQLKKLLDDKIETLKSQPASREVDYGKEGHPMEKGEGIT